MRTRVLLALVSALVAVPALRAQAVYRVPVTGTIELGLAPFVDRSLREAEAAGARLVILDINTPGGRVDAAMQIVQSLTRAEVPVYAVIDEWAVSAGALIALATDSIFMTPDAIIGAATPVVGDGVKASEKVVSAMRAQFRALAERRGLDPQVAAAMVDESIEIPGVVDAGKLLTLTTNEAVELGFATVTPSTEALLAELDLGDATTMRPNWAELLVRFLSAPIVSSLLLSVGMLGLLFEVKTPGFGVGGTIALLALGAFFGSQMIVGLAGWEEVILLVVGVALLFVEVFVVPGFGVAGIAGMLCVGAGVFLALLGNLSTWDDIARASAILAIAVFFMVTGAYALARYLPHTARLGGVFLQAETSRSVGYVAAESRTELIGRAGTALTDLHPSGTALFGEERVDVVSEGGFIGKGTPIEVVRSDGYRHVVRPVHDQNLA